MSIVVEGVRTAADNQIRESSLCVFMRGAGSSAPYGLPVMRDFMDRAATNYFVEKQKSDGTKHLLMCYEALIRFRDHCRHSAWAFQRDWDNVEELYTQADLQRLARIPDPKSSDLLCKQVAWTIWDIYRRCTGGFDFQSISNAVRAANLHPVVITTNYDLLCECSIGFRGTRGTNTYYYPGFTEPDIYNRMEILKPAPSTIDPLPLKRECVPIIKLHGSANWFRVFGDWFATTAIGEDSLRKDEGYAIDRDNLNFDSLVRELFESVRSSLQAPDASGLSPGIIPPMLGKGSIDDPIASQWQAAIKALSLAPKQANTVGVFRPCAAGNRERTASGAAGWRLKDLGLFVLHRSLLS